MAKTLTPDPSKLVPIYREQTGPIQAVPGPIAVSNYQAALSPNLQTVTDTLSQFYSTRLPVVRLAPMPPSANTAANAAANSAAQVIVEQSGGGGTPAATSVSLDVPNIFTPTSQTVVPPLPLEIFLAPEPIGTVFGVLSAQRAAVGVDSLSNANGANGNVDITCNPASASGDWAFFVANGSNSAGGYINPTGPAGWTLFDSTSQLYIKQVVTGLDPVVVSTPIATAGTLPAWAAGLLLVGGTPAFVQGGATSGGFGGVGTTISVAMTGVTAGNSLLVLLLSADGGYLIADRGSIPNFTFVSDNLGQTYQQTITSEGFSSRTTPSAESTLCITTAFIASNVAGGSVTVKAPMGGKNSIGGVLMRVIEISGVTSTAPSIPTFLPPFSVEGPINVAIQNTGGGVTGLLGEANGGTGADLSGTGGANKVLAQATTGAPITVVTNDYSFLAGVNPATEYNSNALAGVGLISVLSSVDLTAKTADISSTFFNGFSASMFQRLTYYMIVTTVGSVSSTLPSLVITWTDTNNSTLQTATLTPTVPAGNTLTTLLSGVLPMNVKGSVAAPTFSTSGYASVGTAMQFALHLRIEAI